MTSFNNGHGKAILLNEQVKPNSSFIVKGDEIVRHNPWHFHPEVELLYCIKGKGTNYIGNHVSEIQPGDLFLIGKNLTHTRIRDLVYYANHQLEKPESIVVKFREDFLGDKFFTVPECSHIGLLLQNALRGVKFHGSTHGLVTSMLKNLEPSGTAALFNFLSILDTLARSSEFMFLNPINFINESNTDDIQKINKVFEYANTHFRETVTLTEVASLLNLTEAAFCRYFKARTRKTFFQYLTEVRVANVCQLLNDNDKDVSQACFLSGFNNPSHFHKQFKKIVKLTPKEYRRKIQERVPIHN